MLTSRWNESRSGGKEGPGRERGLRQTDKHSPVATLISATPRAAIYHCSSHGTLKTQLLLPEVLLHEKEQSSPAAKADSVCQNGNKRLLERFTYNFIHSIYAWMVPLIHNNAWWENLWKCFFFFLNGLLLVKCGPFHLKRRHGDCWSGNKFLVGGHGIHCPKKGADCPQTSCIIFCWGVACGTV